MPGSPINRREFMFGTAAALGLGGVVAHERNAEAQEKMEIERCREAAFQYQRQEIDFKGPYAEITPELGVLLKKIISLQEGHALCQGTQSHEYRENSPVGHNEEKIKTLWPQLSAFIPDLPPYSLYDSFRVFLYELPRFLARYGVAAHIVLAPAYRLDKDKMYDVSFVCNFWKINRIDSDTITDDKQGIVERNVVHVSDDLMIDGTNINNRQFGSAGCTGFKTIFLRDSGLVKDFENLKQERSGFLDTRYNLSAEQISAVIRSDKNPEKAAWLMVLLGLYRKIKTDTLNQATSDSQTIAHETGQLLSEYDADIGAYLVPKPPFDKASDFLRSLGNFMAHDEIEGYIGALQFGNEKMLAIQDVIEADITNEGATDYGHTRGAQWVLEAVVAELVDNAGEYGISLDTKTSLSSRCQVILKLIELTERPELITVLAKHIKAQHAQHYTDDLGSDYVKISHIQEKIDAAHGLNLVDLYKNIGVIGIAALGAGAGLEWLRRRKIEVQRTRKKKIPPRRKK